MTRLVRDVMTTEVVAVEPSTPFMEIVTGLASPNQRSPSGGRRPTSARVVSEADLLVEYEHPDLKANPR
jgi:CBS domain-containing protein